MQPTHGWTGAGEANFKMASSQLQERCCRLLSGQSSQVDLSTGLTDCLDYDSSFFCMNMRQEELQCESTEEAEVQARKELAFCNQALEVTRRLCCVLLLEVSPKVWPAPRKKLLMSPVKFPRVVFL